jgi:hypothetical protein
VSESEEARNEGRVTFKSVFKEGKRTSTQVENQSEIGSNRRGSHRDQEMGRRKEEISFVDDYGHRSTFGSTFLTIRVSAVPSLHGMGHAD